MSGYWAYHYALLLALNGSCATASAIMGYEPWVIACNACLSILWLCLFAAGVAARAVKP